MGRGRAVLAHADCALDVLFVCGVDALPYPESAVAHNYGRCVAFLMFPQSYGDANDRRLLCHSAVDRAVPLEIRRPHRGPARRGPTPRSRQCRAVPPPTGEGRGEQRRLKVGGEVTAFLTEYPYTHEMDHTLDVLYLPLYTSRMQDRVARCYMPVLVCYVYYIPLLLCLRADIRARRVDRLGHLGAARAAHHVLHL